jgi:hypothetical protein
MVSGGLQGVAVEPTTVGVHLARLGCWKWWGGRSRCGHGVVQPDPVLHAHGWALLLSEQSAVGECTQWGGETPGSIVTVCEST